jgi:transposase
MLHSHGLLSPCFIPSAEILELRSLYRLREDQVGLGAMFVQQMQKALVLMNVRLHEVISQLSGVSGLRVIEAILEGERAPGRLADLCAGQILKRKRAQVEASLHGTWEEHHLFALRQALEGYRFCQGQMAACDERIERWLRERTREMAPQAPQSPSPVRHNAPEIEDLHGQLVTLCQGRDAAVLPGLSPLGFLKLVGELGTDLSRWKDEKHFTSWLGLAPGRHESGKRRKRVSRRKTKAGQIFKEGAMSLARSKHLALGGFYRRLKGRSGAAVANTATARKLAVLYYRLMTKGLAYVEQGLHEYEKQYQQQSVKRLKKMAQNMGLTLIESQTGMLI